jgi:hypothetical protein
MQPVIRTAVFLALFAAADAACAAEPLRKWTNPQGRSIQARLISIEGTVARLQLANGDSVDVALDKFSAEDRKYLESRKDATNGGASTKTEAPASGGNSTDAAKTATIELKKNRKWSDRRGKQITARFIRFHEGKAILMQGNKPVDVPFGDLGDADQTFLKERFEALGKGDDVPPAIPTTTRDATSIAGGGVGAAPPPWFAQGHPPPAAGPHNMPPNAMANFPRSTPTPPRIEFPRPVTPPAFSTPPPAASAYNSPQNAPNAAKAGSQQTSSTAAIASAPAFDPSASQSQQPIYQRQTQDISQPSVTSTWPSSRPFGSSFFDSRRASEPQPAPDFSASPSPATSPFSSAPQEMVVQCGKCLKTQKPGFKAGGRCQHCGTVIDIIVDEGGTTVDKSIRATGKSIKFWVAIAVLVISVIGGAIAKLRGS